MTIKHIVCSASLWIAMGSMSSCSIATADDTAITVLQTKDLETLATDTGAARTYDYCYWAYHQGGNAVELPDYEGRLDSETTKLSPEAWSATALLDAGTRIAQSAKSEKSCNKIFKKGTKAFERRHAKSLSKHWNQASYDVSEDTDIAVVQETLAKHWVEDQAARRVYLASRTEDKTGVDHWIRRLAVAHTSQADMRSTAYIAALLNEYDWLDSHRFGERVSMAAWILVQHADDHVDLQALALERMEPYLETGGVDKGNYAYLWDRVAVNRDRKQRFGTQPTWECTDDGKLTLQPLEDPETVNIRRAAMGLGTVEDGLAEMAKSVCG